LSMASTSCWCCTECIQSRLDRRQSAAAAAAAAGAGDDDDDDEDLQPSVYNGLIQTDELCKAQLLCAGDLPVSTVEHGPPDISSCEDAYLVCLPLYSRSL